MNIKPGQISQKKRLLLTLLFGLAVFCAFPTLSVNATNVAPPIPSATSVQKNVNTNDAENFFNNVILKTYANKFFGTTNSGGIIGRIIAGLSVFIIMYAGIMYITARGGDQSKKAKAVILNVFLGLLIYVMAEGIIKAIITFADFIKNG